MCPCINHTWVADAGKTTKLTDPETNVSERKEGEAWVLRVFASALYVALVLVS